MPELPEVETVCRVMRRALLGKRLVGVEIADDGIVYKADGPEAVQEALANRTVTGIGRHGKYWWIELDQRPWVFGHLGMTGWIRQLGAPTARLLEHGNAPLDDSDGRPRFLKFLLTAEDGERVSLTDGRRLARVWLSESPEAVPAIAKLGPDWFTSPPAAADLAERLARKKAPIKAILLDQAHFAGVGNWIADEALYQARIAPARLGMDLSSAEVKVLRKALIEIISVAVEAGAESSLFPPDWMFHHRWGGDKGEEKIGRYKILREEIGGRTTAWVPALQK